MPSIISQTKNHFMKKFISSALFFMLISMACYSQEPDTTTNDYTFNYFKSLKNDEWYFNFSAPNNEIMFQSEGYTRKSSVLRAIRTIKRQAGKAKIIQKPNKFN